MKILLFFVILTKISCIDYKELYNLLSQPDEFIQDIYLK